MTTNPNTIAQAITAITGIEPPAGYSHDATAYTTARNRLRSIVASNGTRLPRTAPPVVGEVAWVHAFGAFRRGIVVKVTPTKAHVAYLVPSNLDTIRVAADTHAKVTQDGTR